MAGEFDIQIELKGFAEAALKFGDPRRIGRPIRRLAERLVLRGERVTKEGTPVDTGLARNSINHAIEGSDIPLWAKWGSRLNYMKALEFGSRPHWPPFSALQPWAVRHGFPAGKSGAFLVARAISKNGTPAHHMFSAAADQVDLATPVELRRASEEIRREMAA